MKNTAKTQLTILKNDEWLRPFAPAIEGRHQRVADKIQQLTRGKKTLADFADGHLYFGLHKMSREWVLREWAPNATDIYLIGTFNDWKETEEYRFKRVPGTGNWEIRLPLSKLHHQDLYK
ncbi:MAG: 1,4-alpha-glucan-branching enzyme, partial [Bacteroidaceae bacterium]|nr:1,4-alpha-glucan-branching enzyme [Bacteroidaceae bacterium]